MIALDNPLLRGRPWPLHAGRTPSRESVQVSRVFEGESPKVIIAGRAERLFSKMLRSALTLQSRRWGTQTPRYREIPCQTTPKLIG